MPPSDLRIRTLFALGAAGAVALTSVLSALAVVDRVRAALERPELLEPAAVLSDVVVALVVAGVVSLILVLLVANGVGRSVAERLGELRVAAIRMADGQPAALPEASRITELQALAGAVRGLAEAHERRTGALRRESGEIAGLIDAVHEGIVQLGPQGRIIRANRAGRALLGLPPGAVGQRIASLVRDARLRRHLEDAAAGRSVEPVELTLDGRRIFVAADPVAGGAVAVLVDLTELRRLEDVRRDFVVNASHELKTPLTSIRGYAETLLGEKIPDDVRRQFLGTIHQNAERLQRIVDDLLDLSRIESGRWRPELEPLPVREAAEEAWSACSRAAAEKGIGFEVRDPADAVAFADPFALGQILSNLFSNAIRYTPAGGNITVGITPAAAPAAAPRPWPAAAPWPGAHPHAAEAGLLTVEVSDTGAGIPGDALGRIFERFYRVDPARSRAEGGTGLGLAIVKHLVESMGGTVSARSELGRGTTIRFQIPAAPHDDAARV